MTTWTTNTVLFIGSEESIDLLRSAVGTGNPKAWNAPNFDFDLLRPTPEKLLTINEPTELCQSLAEADRTNKRCLHSGLYTDPGITTFALTREQVVELSAEYGAYNWNLWRLLNWGTKWNGSSAEILRQGPNAVIIRFDTASAVPRELLQYLHTQHQIDLLGVSIDESRNHPELLKLVHVPDNADPVAVNDRTDKLFDSLFTIRHEIEGEDELDGEPAECVYYWVDLSGDLDSTLDIKADWAGKD